MRKKTSKPFGPKRSRLGSASNECFATTGPVQGSNTPPNSEILPESTSQIRHLTMSQHSNNLLRFLNEDRTRKRFCDVSVSVGGKLYSAHKVVLAHGSSYFHAELSKNPAMTHVTLDHVEDSVFQHLLGFLYTSECVIAERELLALTEAARFLDMMDILKLLCEEGDNNPVSLIQAQARESPEVEMTSSDSPAGDTDIQSSCSRQFRTENPLQSQLAANEPPNETDKTSGHRAATMRRSARSRRTPTKYKKDDMEHATNTPEETKTTVSPREQDEQRVGETVAEIQTPKLAASETSKSAQGEDLVGEEDDNGEEAEMNEDVAAQKKVVEVSAAGRSEDQQGSEGGRTEQQAAGEVKGNVPASGGSNQTPVYPEGLAPVIIQTSSKKTLKCPKCDKTFDRAGGNYGVLHR